METMAMSIVEAAVVALVEEADLFEFCLVVMAIVEAAVLEAFTTIVAAVIYS